LEHRPAKRTRIGFSLLVNDIDASEQRDRAVTLLRGIGGTGDDGEVEVGPFLPKHTTLEATCERR